MAKVKLVKIEAGLYRTADGRYEVLNTTDHSGPPHVRNTTGPKWLVTEIGRPAAFRRYTLADVRDAIEAAMSRLPLRSII